MQTRHRTQLVAQIGARSGPPSSFSVRIPCEISVVAGTHVCLRAVRAKAIYVDRLKSGAIADPSPADKTFAAVMAITGDPLPYGVAPNRREIDAVIEYSVEQGILPKRFAVEEIFAKGTLDLVG